MVPTRLVKMIAGVLLLPVNWVLSRTFFEEFTRATLTHHFWRTEEFYFFMLGAVVWLIAFLGLPTGGTSLSHSRRIFSRFTASQSSLCTGQSACFIRRYGSTTGGSARCWELPGHFT